MLTSGKARPRSAEAERTAADDAVITADHLVYGYPKADRPAVNGVSFTVRRGEIFGLLGPSGAGKSTIQKILTRQFRRITGGAVSVFGRPIESLGPRYYEEIGVGFELPNHYVKLTGLENLRFFASLYRKPTRPPTELLAMVGLEAAADKRVADYSKGMMMRLNFVRALLHDPDLLFFDEPTSGLDPVNARNVKRIIRSLQQAGKTIVLTTHNMFDVEDLCDRCGFMVRGEMQVLDRVAALKKRFGRREIVVTHAGDARETFTLDDLADNAAFLSALRRGPETIHTQEATLEQVFVKVTGVDLAAEAE